jgi:hypothetical protein
VVVEGLRLAHLPLRSPRQLIAKVLVGWLSRKLAYGTRAASTRNSWHFRELFERISAGDIITMSDVRQYSAAIYALNRLPSFGDDGEVRFVEHRFADAVAALARALALRPDDLSTQRWHSAAVSFANSTPPPDWEPIVSLDSK